MLKSKKLHFLQDAIWVKEKGGMNLIMKVLSKLTIKNLYLNKKRTIATIIGIMLSTALICGVAGLVSSFQKTLINAAIDLEGNYHTTFHDVPKDN